MRINWRGRDGSVVNRRSFTYTRRAVVVTLGAVGLAGCLGDGNDEEKVFAYGDIHIRTDDDPVDLSAERFQAEYVDD